MSSPNLVPCWRQHHWVRPKPSATPGDCRRVSVLRRSMITCSQCRIIKREVNHWFLAWTERGRERFCFAPLDSDLSIAREESAQTLCGDRCPHRAVQQFTDSIAPYCRPFYKGRFHRYESEN